MTAYVDDMRRSAVVGSTRGSWSHLFADSHDELMAFARRLRLRPEWIQHEGTHREHFDVTEPARQRALGMGARLLSYPHGTAEFLAARRAALALETNR